MYKPGYPREEKTACVYWNGVRRGWGWRGEEGGTNADKAGLVCISTGYNWICWGFLSFIRHLKLIHRDILFRIIAGLDDFEVF